MKAEMKRQKNVHNQENESNNLTQPQANSTALVAALLLKGHILKMAEVFVIIEKDGTFKEVEKVEILIDMATPVNFTIEEDMETQSHTAVCAYWGKGLE